MIIIHAQLSVQEQKEQQFLEEIHALIAESRAENGNISYSLLKDTEQDHLYTMVEVWKDMAAVASHNASQHFVSFVTRAKELLAAPLAVTAFDGQPLSK